MYIAEEPEKEENWIYFIAGTIRYLNETYASFSFALEVPKPNNKTEASQLILLIKTKLVNKYENIKTIEISSINRIG